jgi:DNA polymerase (family 10)
MARDKGLSISEYGIFRLDTGERVIPGRTEEDIYSMLGLPWIPPELREDRGEIEVALEGRLPTLVEERDIKGDLHVHTNASDGANTIEEMVEAAKSRGYSYIAICDHSQSLKIAGGLSEGKLRARIDEIRRMNERQQGFTVLAGAEVDIRADGTLDYPPGLLRELDIVVASIHSGFKQDKEKMTGRITSAIGTGLVDIFAHPTGRLINKRDPYNVDLERVWKAAAAQGTAMEINCSPDRLDLNDVYSRAAKEQGLKIAIDTDAHGTGDYGNIRYGLFMARRGWLEAGDVLNTMDAGALLTWLAKRRKQRVRKAA